VPNKDRAEGEKRLLEKIAEMPEAGSLHGRADPCDHHRQRARPHAEDLVRHARLCQRDGKVVCFFQSAAKFNSRYATLGFNDTANLDEGAMWPTAFALKELTAAEEAKIARW
jgi:O-methyltransferase involved in polyketide biosynthesis